MADKDSEVRPADDLQERSHSVSNSIYICFSTNTIQKIQKVRILVRGHKEATPGGLPLRYCRGSRSRCLGKLTIPEDIVFAG
jgi:hypothetical protein